MANHKKVENSGSETLLNAIDSIQQKFKTDSEKSDSKSGIVDIITFCEDPRYLDLPNNNLTLYLSQRIILKSFYIGTIGNENLKLTQGEWEWLYSHAENEVRDDVEYEKNVKDVIDRLKSRENATNKASYFSVLHLVLGRRSSKCRAQDDRITTTEGSITYRELCDRLNSNEKIGICTYDPETFKRSVTYDIKSEYNGEVECFEVLTQRGKREISTHNHPYLIWRDNWDKPKFIEMSELLPGDRIATASCTELFGKGGIGVNKAALLGHLIGDGSILHNVRYTTSCSVMLNDIKNLVSKEFDGYSVNHNQKYDYYIVKNSGRFKQNGSQKNKIKEWLESEGCFGKKSIEKEVPECIYRGSKEEISAFISRLFGCDGWAYTDKKSQKGHSIPRSLIGYCSSSKKLIEGVQHLLLKFGIQSIVSPIKAKCNGKIFDSFKLVISRTDCVEKFAKEINIFSKEDRVAKVLETSKLRSNQKSEFDSLPIGIWNYINKIQKDRNLTGSDVVGKHGVGHNERLRKQYSPHFTKVLSYGNNIDDQFLINMGSSDIKWDEVKSITPVGIKKTIALEVKGTNIIGDDIVSHNTVMASIITAYEAYKLLVINDGNPHAYYNLPHDDEIAIINAALSEKQAGRLFGQIQSRIRNSPFFKGRIAKETTSEIRLYTDLDLRKKESGTNISVNGSILLLCGHSNPDSLAGYSAILLLFDEIGFFDETGKVTGQYFYNRLKPSLAKFYKYKAARVVQISSPNRRNGIFYDTWLNAKNDDSILSFQLPTWCVNPEVPYNDEELTRDRKSSPDTFNIEFGAQWATGGIYGNYFDSELVDRCIRGDIGPHTKQMPGFNYYLHVDPARKGNNYAAVLVAKQRYRNYLGKFRNRIFLAGVWIWKPVPGVGLIFTEIDKEIINICGIFRPISVTYDDFQSAHSLQLLQSHGINTKRLAFNRSVKQKIYQNLKELMVYIPEPELFLYDDGGNSNLLISELKNLKFRRISRGIAFVTDKNADVNSDDVCVHPDTIVFTEGPTEIKNVNIGDKILTTDGTYQKIIDKILHTHFNKTLKIHPYYGFPITTTDNHPIEILENNERKWKRADELTENDYVIKTFDTSTKSFEFDLEKYIEHKVSKYTNIDNYINDNKVRCKNANAKWHNRYILDTYEFGYIVGQFISEGSLANHGICFAGNIHEIDIKNKLINCIDYVFGIEVGYNIKKNIENNCHQITINSQIVKKLFLELFNGKMAINKSIPMCFMQGNLEFQKGMLKGFWDGDGCLSKNKYCFTTTSIYLAYQIQNLLLRFGAISGFHVSKRKGKKSIIRGKEVNHNADLYNIVTSDSESFNKLLIILEEGKYKQSNGVKPRYIMKNNFVACKIKDINLDNSCSEVVNLTVENNHTYVSGSINSHNCDCIAGACMAANDGMVAALPLPVTVSLDRPGYTAYSGHSRW